MSRNASALVRHTRFYPIIANLISQDYSLIGPSSFSSSSYMEIDNYLKHRYEITPYCFNVLECGKKNKKFPILLRIHHYVGVYF